MTDLIVVSTDLCRKSIAYICTYLTEVIKKINFATIVRVRDSNVRALANQCPSIIYLNLTETLVTYDVFFKIITTWKGSMVYLCLPHQVGMTLKLCLEQIVNYDNLENLTILWQRNIINPRIAPMLTFLAQFKIMIDSMTQLQYLHIGNQNGLTPNRLLVHTSFTYSKLNMDDFFVLNGFLRYS